MTVNAITKETRFERKDHDDEDDDDNDDDDDDNDDDNDDDDHGAVHDVAVINDARCFASIR